MTLQEMLLRRPDGVLVLLTGVTATLAGCGGPRRDDSGFPPDFVGWVMAVEPGDSMGNGRIVVEAQADKVVRRLIVTVTDDTKILRQMKDASRPIGVADVAIRDRARIWLTEPVPHSFPAQATARQVVVERLY